MASFDDIEFKPRMDLDTYLKLTRGPETEWQKQARAVLIPTPGYDKSYTEIVAELQAGGVSIPLGLQMLADREQNPGGFFGAGHPIRFKRND